MTLLSTNVCLVSCRRAGSGGHKRRRRPAVTSSRSSSAPLLQYLQTWARRSCTVRTLHHEVSIAPRLTPGGMENRGVV